MIDFEKLTNLTIPEGVVTEIEVDGVSKWERFKCRYVSFGDSIAVGHRINDNWETDYGWDAQYGVDGRTETTLVPNCYTDLIHKDLSARVGGKVAVTSFARSGDKVTDLMDKLNHSTVQTTLAKADYVTICIGANDVLHYALTGLPEYLNTGDLSTIDAQVDASLAVLNDDNNPASYLALFNKLLSINSKATYVFTTVYNPYKYLWIDGSKDGFFKPLLDTIPQMTILGVEMDELIKDSLLDISAIKNLVTRANAMGAKAEDYVTRLNTILRNKITAFQASNPNVLLADTKAVFDPVPDRPISAPKHYNDLVNVEFTRGFDIQKADWGQLYDNNIIQDEKGNPISDTVCNDAYTFWRTLVDCYRDGINIDWGGLGSTLVAEIIANVLEPDVDPHPEEYGHHALYSSFSEAFGWSTLPRRTITYNANGGTGSMVSQTVVALDGNAAYTNIRANGFGIPSEGYYFTGWKDGSGNSYSAGQLVGLTGDLTLNAQWSNMYTVIYTHSMDDRTGIWNPSVDTGPQEYYELWLDTDGNGVGEAQDTLRQFTNPAISYRVPYGTNIGVVVGVEHGATDRSYITHYGREVARSSAGKTATYDFQVKGDITVKFEWNYWLDTAIPPIQSYWNCYITRNAVTT